MITQEQLKTRLHYDPETGLFHRLTEYKRWKVGQIAGVINGGYIRIAILGYKVYAHQLAFLYMLGYILEFGDHRNGQNGDNRWLNLREATRTQNAANNHLLKRGVELHGAKYRARLGINNTRIELGSYDTKEEAQAAYDVAADKYFGEFARINRFERRF